MRLRLAAVSVATAAATALVPLPAHAAPKAVVAWQNGYLPSEVVLVQGDELHLLNADPNASHDLRAMDFENGEPLFTSDIAGPGQLVKVDGVEGLPASVYPFFCSVHEFMVGNITVVAVSAG